MNKNMLIGLGVLVVLAGGAFLLGGGGNDMLLGDPDDVIRGDSGNDRLADSDNLFSLETVGTQTVIGDFRILEGHHDRGIVQLGSRDSYINGEVERRVEFGNAAGGVVTGGYLFPVGTDDEDTPSVKHGHGIGHDHSRCGTDFFRPLILQFPDDLGRSSIARVEYTSGSPFVDVDPNPVDVFDSSEDFFTGEDGIDLLYFGTSDRTVGLEWPPANEIAQEFKNHYDASYAEEGTVLAEVPGLQFNCNINELKTQKLGGWIGVTPLDEAGDPLLGDDGTEIQGVIPLEIFVFDQTDHEIFADGFESGDTSAWSTSLP